MLKAKTATCAMNIKVCVWSLWLLHERWLTLIYRPYDTHLREWVTLQENWNCGMWHQYHNRVLNFVFFLDSTNALARCLKGQCVLSWDQVFEKKKRKESLKICHDSGKLYFYKLSVETVHKHNLIDIQSARFGFKLNWVNHNPIQVELGFKFPNPNPSQKVKRIGFISSVGFESESSRHTVDAYPVMTSRSS